MRWRGLKLTAHSVGILRTAVADFPVFPGTRRQQELEVNVVRAHACRSLQVRGAVIHRALPRRYVIHEYGQLPPTHLDRQPMRIARLKSREDAAHSRADIAISVIAACTARVQARVALDGHDQL